MSLSFIENKKELKNIGVLKKYCAVKTVLLPKWQSLLNSFLGVFSRKPLRVWYLRNQKFREEAKRLTKDADLVIIQALRMSQYGFNTKKTIVDIVDTPSLQINRALKHENFLWKLIWQIELPRIKRFEKNICKKFKNILVASEDDKDAMGRGIVLKNGTEITKIKRKHHSNNNIMFLGNMEYPPNIDAVRYFIDKIFPLIKKEIKDVKFYIVGKNPAKIKKCVCKDIILTGFVKDLNKYFLKCKVFAAPLRLGSGIQNKVLEALNYEIPVVTTSIVNKGVEAKNNEEIMVADRPEDFANKVIVLLKNKKQRKKLSANGKKFLKKNYSWDKINRQLDEIINSF
jgi:glycosyltransferase involved in cell wall biosynthesis